MPLMQKIALLIVSLHDFHLLSTHMTKKVLITSALPYVNYVPHLGNIVGCVLPADVYNRWCKQQDFDTLFICGADEYGTCTEVKAMEEGITPRELCDKYIEVHKDVYQWFGIEFDYFGRTSTPDPWNDKWKHTEIAQEIFVDLVNNGYVIEQSGQQLYSTDLDQFIADRYVIGMCPLCRYDKANGDQCDQCGRLLNICEIINPRYKFNQDFTLEMRNTQNLYLDLPALRNELQTWFDSVKEYWAPNAVQVTQAWFDRGLKPRCITRDLKWGTPVPNTEKYGDKYANKVMYNWFDAPIGYISITANCCENWREWWTNNDVTIANMYSKDNIPFHTIIFPASLMGTHNNWNLVTRTASCEYLNYADGKFSKTNGIGIFGDDAMKTGIPSDVYRFYLMIQRPELHDMEFSWNDFQTKLNKELVNNLGNFIHRVLIYTYKTYTQIPPMYSEIDLTFVNEVNNYIGRYCVAMTDVKLKSAVQIILDIAHRMNRYLQEIKPWNLFLTNPEKCQTVMAVLIEIVGCLARLLAPFMPDTAQKIFTYIGREYTHDYIAFGSMCGAQMTKPEPLFAKITDDKINTLKKQFS